MVRQSEESGKIVEMTEPLDASKVEEVLRQNAEIINLLKAQASKQKNGNILHDDLSERRLTPEEWVAQGKVKGKVREVSKVDPINPKSLPRHLRHGKRQTD